MEKELLQQDEQDASVSRRALHRRGLIAGAAALVTSLLATRTADVAAQANPMFLDTNNRSTAFTGILTDYGVGFQGESTATNGTGLVGLTRQPAGGIGIKGLANKAGVGVQGGILNIDGSPLTADSTLAVQGVNFANGIGNTAVQGLIQGTGDQTFGMEGRNNGNGTGRIGVLGTIADTPTNTLTTGVVGLNLNTGPQAYGVFGHCDTAGGVGVQGQSASGLGGRFVGGFAPIQLAPAATGVGAPTTGAHATGEFFVDSVGGLFFCRANGAPGTWIALGGGSSSGTLLITLPTPERFVDTRNGLGGVQGPVPANTTRTFQMTGRLGQSGNPALIIPDSATVIIGNLTVIGAAGIPLGSYVTLWPGGAQPLVSNINYGPAGTLGAIANTFIVGLASVGGHGAVNVYNLSACDYILDVTGYYTSPSSAPTKP